MHKMLGNTHSMYVCSQVYALLHFYTLLYTLLYTGIHWVTLKRKDTITQYAKVGTVHIFPCVIFIGKRFGIYGTLSSTIIVYD